MSTKTTHSYFKVVIWITVVTLLVTTFFLLNRKEAANTNSNHNDYNNDYRSKVKGVTVIPNVGIGSYSSQVIHQLSYLESSTWSGDPDIGKVYWSTTVNDQQISDIPNIMGSVEQLNEQLPNTEWVALTIGWFLNFETQSIKPMVEKKEELELERIIVTEQTDAGQSIEVPYERSIRKNVLIDQSEYALNINDGVVVGNLRSYWSVGKYTRDSAEIINPFFSYGETPSDQEVLEAVQFYKSKGYKVMISPFLLGYQADKPWRGRFHLPSKESVQVFMTKEEGYNAFIQHYIDLLKDQQIDGFLVGSEMEGLTLSAAPDYPAVDHLIELVKVAKKEFATSVQVSYAANWSEYHHDPNTGIYHLDPLWKVTDFVGIDAYFPLTEKHSTDYKEIYAGWESGEYYDYYYSAPDFTNRHSLTPAYAIKNIRYWWENEHINPDGERTDWQPKSKSIWFTELGFASVDSTTVQPNAFVDATSVEGGYPRGSTKETSFDAQAVALSASLDYLGAQEWMGQVFVWTWDLRPYPIFPLSNLWSDSDNWQKGHWLNGKSAP